MSFSSGATLSVGTLEAQFQLNASAATASIAGIQSQMTTLRQSFTQNNILNVNTTAATANINKATSALDNFKKGLEYIGAYYYY